MTADQHSNILVQIDDFAFSNEAKYGIDNFKLDVKASNGRHSCTMNKELGSMKYVEVPTPYRISTMTILSSISSRVDLYLVYKNVSVFPIGNILNVRYFDHPTRGIFRVKQSRKLKKNRQIFLNQITFDVKIGEGRIVSAKLFKDGKIQMAGCKRESDAAVTMKILVSSIWECSAITLPGTMDVRCSLIELQHLETSSENTDHYRQLLFELKYRRLKQNVRSTMPIQEVSYMRKAVDHLTSPIMDPLVEVVMINSDFDSKVSIDKEKLVNVLKGIYGIHCRPTTSRYPGINAKFISNATCEKGCTTSLEKKRCSDIRKRKKSASGCVTVSILAFAQGKIIITGARAIQQLEETYDFITGVFRENYHQFAKVT